MDFQNIQTLRVYIYAGVALDARILEVQPIFRAATRSPADRTPKFSTARFPANSSASFSGHLVRSRRQPPPLEGSPLRPLRRRVFRFSTPCPFDAFPNFVFSFPASSSMDIMFIVFSGLLATRRHHSTLPCPGLWPCATLSRAPAHEHSQVATAAPARACKHAARPGRPTAAAAPLDACARGCATDDAARSPPGGPPTSPGRVPPSPPRASQQAPMATALYVREAR